MPRRGRGTQTVPARAAPRASHQFSATAAGVQAIVGAAGLAWAVASNTLSLSTLPSLGIQLSNSFGLFCVLTLLGYGLVAIPKKLWKRSYPQRELRHQLYRFAPILKRARLSLQASSSAGGTERCALFTPSLDT